MRDKCSEGPARVQGAHWTYWPGPPSSSTEKAGSEKSDPPWRSECSERQRQPRRRQGRAMMRRGGEGCREETNLSFDGSLPRLTSGSRRAPFVSRSLRLRMRSSTETVRGGTRARQPSAAERSGGASRRAAASGREELGGNWESDTREVSDGDE